MMFDPTDPAFAADPWPAYAALREAGLTWHEGLGMWLAARFADVEAIVTDRRMVRSAAAFAPPEEAARRQREANFHDMPFHERFVQTSMLEVDGPDHDRLRRAVFPFFTRTVLGSLRPAAVALAESVILPALGTQVDAVADLATPIPGRVIGRLVGTGDAEATQMTAWSDAVVSYFDPDRTPAKKAAAEAATRAMHDRLAALRAERRAAPRDDLMSTLIAAEDAGTLTPDEVIATAMQLLHAGHGSTVDAIGNGIAALLAHPQAEAALRADPARMADAVQEMFRHAAPLPFFHRFASEDLTVAGRDFPKGTMFGVLYAAANRDPAMFPDPDRFDPARKPNRHLAFGGGPHGCLGNALARLTMEAFFTTLLARTAAIEAAGPAEWKPGLQAHGPVTLPLRLVA